MELVTDGDTKAGTDLVFPLAGHDLSIGSGNLDTSIEACTVVGISDHTSEAVVSTDRAIVGTLRTRVTIVRPAEGPGGELGLSADKSILLLDTVPWFFLGALVKDFFGEMTEVGISRFELLAGAILPAEGLGHNEDVVTLAEWVTEDSNRLHNDFRVVGGGLVAG